jgi:hypothetical protein
LGHRGATTRVEAVSGFPPDAPPQSSTTTGVAPQNTGADLDESADSDFDDF